MSLPSYFPFDLESCKAQAQVWKGKVKIIQETLSLSHSFTREKTYTENLYKTKGKIQYDHLSFKLRIFFSLSMTPIVHTLVFTYTLLQLITMSYIRLHEEIK